VHFLACVFLPVEGAFGSAAAACSEGRSKFKGLRTLFFVFHFIFYDLPIRGGKQKVGLGFRV
jgi:hypothetical protein